MDFERYQRQILLQQLGVAGQEKLHSAHVLVIGAGGLGCPALQYLAAAGVGHIGIVDHDMVDLSNLHRQILFGTDDIGQPKVQCAKKKLTAINPSITIKSFQEKITQSNVAKILESYEIILDCTDNFATRYLINDACVLMQKKLVFGAISQWQGQVAIFNASPFGINYRDLFPIPPQEGEVKNCGEAGVIGVLPGIIGTMMACETIKLICNIGQALVDKIFSIDVLSMNSYTYGIQSNEAAKKLMPKSLTALTSTDYEAACGIPSKAMQIDAEICIEKVGTKKAILIDIRNSDELPKLTSLPNLHIPMADLHNNIDTLNSEEIILFCQSGKRSLVAANQLAQLLQPTQKIYSLEGGILSILAYTQRQ
jgi:sulfur-carrier protein adenylyltransferase/sulfurtransferase